MANYLCNDLAMDTISCGNLFAWPMDIYDLGVIDRGHLDGISMNWSEDESICRLIPKIAKREGVGDLLAEGSYRVGRQWGAAALEMVIHSKKQEYPGYESRRSFGAGFSLVTSNRGLAICERRSMSLRSLMGSSRKVVLKNTWALL